MEGMPIRQGGSQQVEFIMDFGVEVLLYCSEGFLEFGLVERIIYEHVCESLVLEHVSCCCSLFLKESR